MTFTATDTSGNKTIATTTVTILPQVDLALALSMVPAPVVSGAPSRLRFTVSNHGPSDATAVIVKPVLPPEIALRSILTDIADADRCTTNEEGTGTCEFLSVLSLDALCTQGANGLSCAIGTVQKGKTLSFDLTIDLPGSYRGPFDVSGSVNGAEITDAAPDLQPDNNTSAASFVAIGQSNLSLSFSAPASVVAGTNLSYTFTAANLGPSDAPAVAITHPLPAGATATQVPAGCVMAGTTLSCTAGALTAGQSAAFAVTLSVDPSRRGSLALLASVSGVETDPADGNNAAASNVTLVAHTDISVAGTIASSPVMAGAGATYTLRIANAGPSDATNLLVRVQRFAGLAFDSTMPAGCSMLAVSLASLSEPGGSIHCDVARLEAGADITLAFGLSVDAFARGTIRLDATVASQEGEVDQNADNNAIRSEATIDATTDLMVTVAQSGETIAGRTTTYRLTMTNNGPSGATGVELLHTPPAGTSFESADGCALDNSAVRCVLGSMDPGTSSERQITLQIGPPARGTLTARFEMTSEGLRGTSERDPDLANNTASFDAAIQAHTDLAITLAADSASVVAGRTAPFTARVTNHGPSDASAITIDGPGDNDPQIDALAAGESRTIALEMAIDPFARGMAQVRASVHGVETDGVSANNDASAEVRITTEVDLLVTMTAPDPALAGASLGYEITLTNNGPSGAMGVHLSQLLPAGGAFESAAGCTFAAGEGADQVGCAIERLAPGATERRRVVVAVDPSRREPLTSTVFAAADDTDTDVSTNQFTLTTGVRAEANLHLSVTASPNPAAAGQFIKYAIEVLNAGPSTATSLELTHRLPTGVTSGPIPAGCTFAVPTVTCALETLAPNASWSLTLTAVPVNGGVLTAVTEVAAAEDDPDHSDNSAMTAVQASGPSNGAAGAGDFDGDGDLDLAVADEKAGVVKIYVNIGAELVEIGRVSVGQRPEALAIGDLDGDGDLDIATVNRQSNDVSILVNDGRARFAEVARPDLSGKHPVSITVGDFNGDGDLDIVAALKDRDGIALLTRDAAGQWSESWANQQRTHAPAERPSAVAAGDIDGDGDLDLALVTRPGRSVVILANDGLGTFAEAGAFATSGSTQHEAVSVGDFDGDGDLDIAVAGRAHDLVSLLSNDGAGRFEETGITGVGKRPEAIAAGDFNGDGALDLITANRNDDSLSLLVNAGDGFPSVVESPAGNKPIALVAGDFDGDGKLDVVVVSEQGYAPQLLVSR